jgi:hypothetical protein
MECELKLIPFLNESQRVRRDTRDCSKLKWQLLYQALNIGKARVVQTKGISGGIVFKMKILVFPN